jgi:hypothetical protein
MDFPNYNRRSPTRIAQRFLSGVHMNFCFQDIMIMIKWLAFSILLNNLVRGDLCFMI